MIAIAAKNPIGHMAPKEPKVTLSASIEPSYKERFEAIAKEKRWTLSQTVQYFIEECLDDCEVALGVGIWSEQSKPSKTISKKSSKP